MTIDESTELESLRKRLEEAEEKLRAQNEASFASELTLGLLHKLNNVMTGIFFTVEACQMDLDPSHPVSEEIKSLAENAQKAQQLIERTTEVNLSNDEVSYHELSELLNKQLDVFKIILPKTTQVQVIAPTETMHVQLNDVDFRTILLSIARTLKPQLTIKGRPLGTLFTKPATQLSDHENVCLDLAAADSVALVFRVEVPTWAPEAHVNLAETYAGAIASSESSDLAFAHQLAVKHGGRLAVRPESGALEFILFLPRTRFTE